MRYSKPRLALEIRSIPDALVEKLGYQIAHYPARDVREAKPTTLKLVKQSLVVDAHEVEHGGMEVVDVDGVFGDVVAVVIGFSVSGARLDTSTSEPD